MRSLGPVLAVAVLAAVPVAAQIPLGSEFRVDTQGAILYSIQGVSADAAMAANGRFIVAWAAPPEPGAFVDQVARRFDAAGRALGVEFRVNSYTTGRQYDGQVAADDDGNFVVVWTSNPQAGSHAVFGQRYAASGAPLGSAFQVNETTTAAGFPAAAMRRDGGFVVVWKSGALHGRLYAPSGAPIGGAFQVDSYATLTPFLPSVDFDDAGSFVVVWEAGPLTYPSSVRGRLFSAAGVPQGAEFVANTSSNAFRPRVARSANGAFVIAWHGWGGAYARRFDPAANPLGPEFLVNSSTTGDPRQVDLDVDADGDFVVAWHEGYIGNAIFARRFDSAGTPTGPDFKVNAATTGSHQFPTVAADRAGNFVIAWHSGGIGQVVLARRYAGGVMGAALAVDPSAGPTSDGNHVLEAGETVTVAPSWLNGNPGAETFGGVASAFTGPGTSGDPTYSMVDAAAAYGTVASGATASCTGASDCYALGISVPSVRPAHHWDAAFREEIVPAPLGGLRDWTLHVGESFTDVPRSNIFYRFVETLLHYAVTGGCTAAAYCPAAETSREQMAVFVLAAKEGAGYQPPACATPRFLDVPASSAFCPWIEELARRGVVAGCGGGNYCPSAPVSRQEMAVFVLATKEPGVQPPACTTPAMFTDVPAGSPFCRWVEELARRGVVTGCGGGAYCPAAPVTREQMGVFLSVTFGLALYGV